MLKLSLEHLFGGMKLKLLSPYIKPKIHDIYVTGHEWDGNEKTFDCPVSISICVEIGEEGKKGYDNFQVVLQNRRSIDEQLELDPQQLLVIERTIVMETLCLKKVRKIVEQLIIDRAPYRDFKQFAGKVSSLLGWEFEGMDAG